MDISFSSTALVATPHQKTSPIAVTKLNPTTVQPLHLTWLLVKLLPVSQIRCSILLYVWNVNGHATVNLARTLTRTGREANAAAIEADSRCQPNAGAARYARPKR